MGGGSTGYECTETTTLLTNESVTTAESFGTIGAVLAYSNLIEADTINVTFDGTEYVCTKQSQDGLNVYGAPRPTSPGDPTDWSEYPFSIISSLGGIIRNSINTQTASTYQVKIEALNSVATTSPCFETAVHSVVDEDIESLKPMIIRSTQITIGGGSIEANFIDIYNAFRNGKRIVVVNPTDAFEIASVAQNANGGGTVIGGDGHTYTASADDTYPSYSQGSGGGTTT